MAAQPNIYDSHWTRCNSGGHSATRIVNYILRRPDDKERPTRNARWSSVPEERQIGDAGRFKEEANRRRDERLASAAARGKDISQDHSPKNVQYLHIVISPGRRDEFGNEDFKALAAPWVRDGSGRTFEHFGAVHYDDREGPKLHLVVARDKLKGPEFAYAKERSDEICRERERFIDRDRAPRREPDRAPGKEPDPGREAEPGAGRG